MKQRLAPLLLVLALCAGLAAPALAGDEPVPGRILPSAPRRRAALS
jgi:hypothetical protein